LPAKETSQKVVITTIHKAKGLEWDSVFIINCNDEFFPGGGEIEEERRIFYVAITRAKQRLFICFTENSKARKLTRFCCECENKLF
jgi:DNA helicase-2/ATP-dependent DNA helicase PcrA